LRIEISVADEGFARIFIFDNGNSLKLDFVNDVAFRFGIPSESKIFTRTDNILNILSNKVSALGRYSPKDVVDIVFICEYLSFNWEIIFNNVANKDIWINPINAVEIIEQFPSDKLKEIIWINKAPSPEWFTGRINQIIPDILTGRDNSLFNRKL